MKKRILLIMPILILMLTALYACGPTFYVHRYNIKSAHKEWADAIGLFLHDDLKVLRYNTDNNEISLSIEYLNGMEGYEEFCDVINAHNKFVAENPDFFRMIQKLLLTTN